MEIVNSMFGRLAQLVERFIYTEDVAGSNPASPTKYLTKLCRDCQDGQGACLKNMLCGSESCSRHKMLYFVYMVQAMDKSIYTGYTIDVKKRVETHNVGKYGSKSLRGKLPVKLVHFEEFKTKSEALKREAEIKSWTREKKLKLVYPRG